MLVLGRKPKQGIRINNDIVVKVVAIKGNRVTLGFEAPRCVRIVRDELDQKKGGQDGKGNS